MEKLIIAFYVVIASYNQSFSQISPSQLLDDIEELEVLINTNHIAPYRLVSKTKLQSVIRNSKKKIASQDRCDEVCYVEILRVVAALNDGHSLVKSTSREALFGYLPFSTKWYKDGLFVTRVPEKHKDLLGSRLESINGVEINVVLEKLKDVLPHGNLMRFKKFAYQYIRMPGLLYGLGITDDSKRAIFTLSKEGSNTNVIFKNMGSQEYDETTFISYDDIAERIPLFNKQKEDYYWYRYDAKNKIFYFKYNRIGNMENERASTFAQKMWSKVDSLDVDKFVLDIRNNGGGQFAFSMSFIQGILDRPEINVPGKLFVISGYDTFSAALDMLRNLEVKSNSIILGEPPGDYAASSGDPEPYTLKNTGIVVQLSSVFHPTVFSNDMRSEILIDKKIESSWKDYKSGNDPLYEYVKNYNVSLPEFVAVEKYKSYLGRYKYDSDKHLILKSIDGYLFLEISKSLISPLYMNSEKSFTTEVNGLSITLKNKCIKVNFPDGKKRSFKKLNSDKSGIEYLYEGDFENARKVYYEIKENDPGSILIRDGRFSNLALFAFFELQKTSRENASSVAKGILNLGIEINNGEAPFCVFSLRFY